MNPERKGYEGHEGRGGGDGAVRDPGAQPERTRLAWRRTTLAFAVVVVLTARGAAHGQNPLAYVAVALVALVWLVFLVVAHRRVRALTAVDRPRPLEAPAALAAVACTLALPICGVVVLR